MKNDLGKAADAMFTIYAHHIDGSVIVHTVDSPQRRDALVKLYGEYRYITNVKVAVTAANSSFDVT